MDRSVKTGRRNLSSRDLKPSERKKSYEARVKLNIPDFRGMAQMMEDQNTKTLRKVLTKKQNSDYPQTEEIPSSAKKTEEPEVVVEVENPWIKDITSKQPLEVTKRKPARHIDTIREQQKSFRPGQTALKPEAQAQDESEALPGMNIERTRKVLEREYPNFEFPNLKSTRDIRRFDCWIEERTPEQWVEFYRGKPGPHAMSPVFDGSKYTWEPVNVLKYNPNTKKFTVQASLGGIQKEVNRLSVRFVDENEADFEARVSQARTLQQDYESEVRFMNYVDEIPGSSVSQLRKETKTKILKSAVATNKDYESEKYVDVFKTLMAVVDEEYVRAMKSCVVLRKMQNPENDNSFELMRLPVKRSTKEVPYFGTISIPDHQYSKTRKRILERHWYRIPEVVQVNKIMSSKCYSFQDFRFLLTHNLEMPLELSSFYKTQSSHHSSMRQQILIHWREYLISETQDKMAEKYNFFAVDSEQYMMSDLHLVLRRMDIVMNTHIRNFSQTSIQEWVDFLRQFSEPQDSNLWTRKPKPLLILHLHVERGARTKKDAKDKEKEAQKDKEAEEATAEKGTVDFKPSIEKAEKLLLGCIDWIKDSTNRIINLETDLVPFMNIPKTPVYELTEESEVILQAKQQINKMLNRYTEGPKALLEKYKKFEWIGKLKMSDFLGNLFDKKPDIEKIKVELSRLRNARSELWVTSNDLVDYEIFQIECQEFKSVVMKKIDDTANSILKRMADFCEQEVASIDKEYQQICEKVMTLPKNEDELFELKRFTKNIKKRKEELLAKEQEIIQQTLILEDYLYSLDDRVDIQLWNLKSWPIQVDIAVKEGGYKLEAEEEKFREKLDKEKHQWYRELAQIQNDFEAVQQFGDYDNAANNYDEVKRLEDAMDESMKQLNSFIQRETQFELQISDTSDLERMMAEFAPFNKLWTNVSSFKNGYELWMKEKKIQELNANEITSKVDLWFRECFMLSKKLMDRSPEAIAVINNLKEHIEEFQHQLPIIKALSNEALTDDHWKQLTAIAGLNSEPLDPKHETVATLNEKGLGSYIEQIEELSYRAQREYRLKKKLEEMKKIAEGLVLEIMEHKDTYKIRTVEDIQTLLDEQIVNVQAMKTSPYARPIEKQCREWEYRLQHIQLTLEEWIKCQRVWMNLEPIFSSDDIQKQMPMEYRKFKQVDATYRNTMDASHKDPGLLDCIATDGSTLASFTECNTVLDEIQKLMNQYLEHKRLSFPRFFFLSDEDLIDIISQTKDPLKVQDHLNKCFEAIDKVVFSESFEILKMVSPEKEEVDLIKKIDVNEGEKKGNVELWMGELEKIMFKTMQTSTVNSFKDYSVTPRTQWVKDWPGMVILCVNYIYWTEGVERALRDSANNGLKKYEDKLQDQLMDIVELVRKKLPSNLRRTLGALVTLDVHAKDIVTELRTKRVSDLNSFDWIAQLRYYWESNNDVMVKMVNSAIKYGFEYLGNSARLVITPLTDRCYRTLMGAYVLFYGGAPEGPAGTGKTESVKDLAKAMAVKCVVFNCSDNLDYKAMGKFFKGLASSGSWCCFDEFNRINPEVLSVVAMQVLQIQQAIRDKKRVFQFEGTQLNLVHSCAINITMNPGYAGRSELPDNLKALFRPCAMMVPDYALISEISLFSYGFKKARELAAKVVASLRLSSEQLSTQSHYDFGMRAVKAILVACGNLKMKYGEELTEDLIALRALMDVNLPKFTSNDIPLFTGITSDLFPNVQLPEIDYEVLLTALRNACAFKNLQPKQEFLAKCIQLYETILVRHGLMLVGQTFSGKTNVIQSLQIAFSSIFNNPDFVKTHRQTINPKSITQKQLYGSFNEDSHEWSDGVLALVIREFAIDKSSDRKWVVFDGPVDAVWIENMNTVLDDNKMLCLSSGEIIKLTETITMMFEVEDLKVASPATVSRCGMVYLEPSQLGWEVLIDSYINTLPYFIVDAFGDLIRQTFIWFCWPLTEFTRKCKLPVPVTEMEFVYTALNIFDCFMGEYHDMLKSDDGDLPNSPTKEDKKPEVNLPKDLDDQIKNFILFSVIWGFGGSVDEKSRPKFSDFLSKILDGENVRDTFRLLDLPDDWHPQFMSFKLPAGLFDCAYTKKKDMYCWIQWLNLLPGPYSAPKELEFHELIVPTKDTIRVSYLMNFIAPRNKHVLFSGPTGTGKTITILNELRQKYYNENYTFNFLAFSAQTSSNKTQMIIDGSLDRKRRGVFGPTGTKQMIIFVDDLNMPQKEEYGAQPPIELLRQWMDHGGWYDLETKEFRNCIKLQFIASMGPPSGGRNDITQRYLRHYNKFYIEPFDEESLNRIFGTVVEWFYSRQSTPFSQSIISMRNQLIEATISIFNRSCKELLPTPTKSHYTFNLRDLSKVFQGISKGTPQSIRDESSMIKLWAHECMRVFMDRLINFQDREFFESMIRDSMKRFFKRNWEDIVKVTPLLFGDFVPMPNPEEGKQPIPDLYHELLDHKKLREQMEEFLNYYNQITSVKMNLVLFMAAIETVVKVVRIIKQPYGNVLLVGVGGSGRKSMTQLAICIAEYVQFEVEVSKNFGMNDWRDQIKKLFFQAGLENKPTVFLFNDTQIANEGFLEDINNLLNNGDVPNLMETEEKQNILENLKDLAITQKRGTSPEEIYAFFIERVRMNLHLAVCLSPIGEKFRKRLRMFPSLVNCTTIMWFLPWPQEALRSVAYQYLADLDVEYTIKSGIVDICVDMQQRVTVLSDKYREELRRYYYVTPTSYLELINTFKYLLDTKRVETKRLTLRYEVGLDKLLSTAEKVAKMQIELEELQPKLIVAQNETKVMMVDLTKQQKEAQIVQDQCALEEAKTKEEADKAQAIKQECEEKLEAAMPTYRAALKALQTLTKNDLNEVRALSKPPKGVVYTMEAVCKLMGIEPIMVPKASGFGKEPDYWETAKKNLLNRPKLIEDLEGFDKDNIDPDAISKIEKIYNDPEFKPDKVQRSSIAAKGLCMWVRAMYQYDGIMKEIRPKQAALKEAEETLAKAMAELAEKKEALRSIQELVAKLQADYQAAVDKERDLQNEVDMCKIKLNRAEKLIDGLKDERVRWAESAAKLRVQYKNLVGDLIISSGIIAYLGVFTGSYRSSCIESWVKQLNEKAIPASEEYSLQTVLGDPMRIREWVMHHLPNDNFSIDNAIILDQSKRWPLLIDPQTQANTWIKKLEGDKLDITRLNKDSLINTLINAINYGRSVLIENIQESLNPELEALLSTKKGTEGFVKIGDKTAEMSRDFRLYITTKLPRPHYPPEICVRVTLLNFLTTEEGLLDQMLATTVNAEAPHIEASRQKCIQDSARFKKELKRFEDEILNMLSNSDGDILENETLIETLHNSKQTSKEIQEQLEKQENIQKHINETRKNYRPVAFRVSQLFFVVADLSNIEPMYQYSLEWYERIYLSAISEAERASIVAERAKNLIQKFTYLLYQNVCRSLFEKDKLLFSFLICLRIMQSEDRINSKELRFIMTGGTNTTVHKPNPTVGISGKPWLNDKEWATILELATYDAFHGLDADFNSHSNDWKRVYESADPEHEPWPSNWQQKLTPIQQMLILRVLRPDKVVSAVEHLISKELSSDFIVPPPFDLELSFKDSAVNVPLIFVLSPGVDPINEVEKLALKMNCRHRMKAMSLGEGQGKFAEDNIDRAMGEGGWVILQNCHLAASWMPTLERKVEEIVPEETRDDFRLWLTSMPSEKFPVSILQNGIKITNEPPKGLKQNLLRSYGTYDANSFEDCAKPREWKRLLYGLSFFHALIQERRKFGALGWNIPYEFSMSDLSISVSQLKMFLNNYEIIPYEALNYMVAEANYGGRVTDYWDRRTINVLLTDFYTPDMLRDDYKFSPSGTYQVPPEGVLSDYMQYIREKLPHSDLTEVFGLHDNASITSAINETNQLLSTCLSLLPRTAGSAEKTADEILTEKAQDIFNRMPDVYDIEFVKKKFPIMYEESMNTVLIQELIRYNRLISVIRTTTVQLKQAIAGLVSMSQELEGVGNAIFDNLVPKAWKDVSYPSLKPLGFWLNDLLARLKFLQDWIDTGAPNSFWISGFFFTQSFLTGTMQNYARKYKYPIDTLCFDFEVQSESMKPENIHAGPSDGCYVYGLFLDGARWDDEIKFLNDPIPKVLHYPVPMIWLKPCKISERPKRNSYECPVYKTSSRAGTLSTTGHSTNFVLSILLPMQPHHTEKHWVKRGAAMLTQLDY